MLPKIWKKVLLAVCIVACIFNVMSKLVNRHSLEFNLKSVNDGKTIWDSLHKEEKEESDTIEGVHDNSSSNITNENTEIENENIENRNQENNFDNESFVVEL